MFHRSQNYRALTLSTAVGLTLVLAVTACFASGSKIDACKLVSATEASRVFGTRVTVKAVDTSAAGSGAASICNYNTGSLHGGFMLLAGRIHYTDAAAEVAYQKQAATLDIPPGMAKPSFTDVNGLGEAAYLLKTQGSFQLHVLAHGTAIVISMIHDANAKSVSQARALAAIALQHLH